MSSCLLPTGVDDKYIQSTNALVQSRPLRVLTLTPFFPSQQDPTQGRFISEPLGHLESMGVANKTFAVQPFYRAHRAAAENVSATWVRYFSPPTNLGLATAGNFLAKGLLRTVLEEHRRRPFDLLHAHAALPCGHAAMLVSQRLSIPFVVSVHGLDAFFTRQAGGFAGAFCERVARGVYGAAAFVICISEKVREQVISKVPAETTVIYNGVDVETFSPASSENSPPTVLSVGNLIPTKGHACLIRAFQRVLKVFPECVLEIVGDGPERENLIQLAGKLGISAKVRFLPRQSKSEMAESMRRCTVFALPSVFEGLGCVYLEAMACAKPVIGCYEQGIDEVIQDGETGILVPPEDWSRLSDAILSLLRNPDLCQKIGSRARELMVVRFSVRQQGQQIADVYYRCTS